MSTSPPTSPSDDNVFHYHSCSSEGATYSSRAALPQRKLFSNSVIGGGSYGSIHASASFSSPSFTTSPSNSSPTNNSRQRRFYSNSELSPKATTLDTNPLHLNNNNQSIASTLPKDMDHSPKTEKIRQSSKLYKEEEINSHSSSVQCFSCLHVKPGHSRPGKLYITQSHLIFLYKDILNLDRMESPPPPSSLIDYPNLVKSQNQPQYPFQFDSTRDKQNQKQKKETEKKSIPHSGRFGKHCMDRHAKRDFDHDHDSPFNPIINNDFDDDSDSSSHSLDSSISLSISLENIGQFDDDDSHDLGENDSFLFKQIEQEAKNKLQELDDEGDYPNHYHDTPSTPVRKYIRSVEKKAEQYLNKLDLSDHDLERYIDSELSPRSEDSRQNEYEHEQMYTIEDSLYDVNGFQWVLSDLAEIYPRHYHMKDIALELFGHDQNQKHYKTTQKNKPKLNIGPLSNTSLYLAFCNDQYDDNIDSENAMSGRNNFLSLLQKQTIPNLTFQYGWYKKSKNKNKHSLYYLTLAWKHSQISNYDYLIRLNAMSGRSKHDVGQYPVLPWVLSNYTSQTLPNLSDTRNFRDLKKPMGAQDESRRVKFLEKYRSLCEGKDSEPCSDPPFMYGSHYSSPGGVVLHYLVRLRPFAGLHKQLQGGEFDVADRLFDSIPRTWDICSKTSPTEVKELTPEWYSDPSFLCNHNQFQLGRKRADGTEIGDVALPPWADGKPDFFVQYMRTALESDLCSEMLPHWIDLIFGYKQKGVEAAKATNLFYHLTYYDTSDLKKIRDESVRKETELHIADFGHCPTQLFYRPHPKKKKKSPK